MNNFYIGICLSLFCVLLAYFFLSKLLLVTVFCVILVGVYFKDDFTLFRYVATHVASFYLWICELCSSIQIMYHQSNSANFPVRKCIENNGIVSNKIDRLHHRLKTNVHNLNTSYSLSNQPLSSSNWNTSANNSLKSNPHSNKSSQSLQEISKLSIHPRPSVREDGISPIGLYRPYELNSSRSPLSSSPSFKINRTPNSVSRESYVTSPNLTRSYQISRDDNNSMQLDAKLFANVNSPGFCGRVAEGLGDVSTHQFKYDTAGAFPVVNFKNQSPKIKLKTPVRVRLSAPISNDILYSSIVSNSPKQSSLTEGDESMKSVLQVLKEISRKRIHSHVDEDSDENSKRLRISETQYNPDSMLQSSLLQQTIQGKRAREESSPTDDDGKKRRRPSLNNEYMSSLSSSLSVKAPHLKCQKRKAQDLLTTTAVLGKLLKVQTEVTPPPSSSATSERETPSTPVSTEISSPQTTQDVPKRRTPSPMIADSSELSPAKPTVANTALQRPAKPEPVTVREETKTKTKDESSVSRLLGRMSGQSNLTPKLDIPVAATDNMFMSTNDLSLSPPKENRLAAMIAVLGGPSEINEAEIATPENKIVGKVLFTSPETPETPKLNKKVTFNDSLTSTKIYDRDKSGIGIITKSEPSILSPSTNKSTESSLFNLSQPVSSPQETSSTSKLNFQFGSNGPVKSEESKVELTSQSSLATTPNLTSLSAANNTSNPSPKPAMFSFGSGKDSSSTSTGSTQIEAKPFSFGSAATTQATSVPSIVTPQKSEPTKGFMIGGTSTSQPGLSMFSNKETPKEEKESKPLVNGFTPATSNGSLFAFNSTSQSSANKPALPSFGANAAKSPQTPTFNFTSTNMFSGSQSNTVSSTVASNTPVTNTAVTNSVPSNPASPASSMFSIGNSASKPSFSFGAQSQNAPPAFGISTASSTQQPAQNSMFGNSSATLTTATTQNSNSSAPQGSLFGGVSSGSAKAPVFGGTTGSGSAATAQSTPVLNFSATPTTNSPFSLGTTSSTSNSQPSLFGVSSSQTPSNSVFGNATNTSDSKPSLFSSLSATTGQSSPFNNTTTTSQVTKPMFNMSNSTPKFGEGNASTPTFGSATGTSAFGSQSNAPPAFGSQSNTPSVFGNQSNATPAFGSQTNTANAFGGQANATPTFGSQASATPTFGNQSNATPAFGSQQNAAPTFGSQTNATPTFGSQTSATPTFGSQANATPSFGSQTNSVPAYGSQNGTPAFGSQGSSFNLGANSSTAETKPAFGSSSSSPFVFGSATTSSAQSKPTAAAAPFSFGGSQPSTPLANSSQPSLPAFNAPTPAFGGSQQPPSFAASVPQAAAPAAGPVFAFGQNTAAPAVGGFQFNPAAAPQPVAGGGMFNIGSGSTAPRSKTGALRRRQKP